MKKSVISVIFIATFVLSACAITPEQRAAREEQQRRAARALEIHLAEQCDPQVASVMRQIDDLKDSLSNTSDNLALAENKELDELSKRYQEEITKPLFHNCYRMAWENYINQRRLEAAERRANYYEDRIHFWHYHMPPPPRRYYRR
ncbi:MAG: hypothetical protein IKI22_01220 [Neisseriaceae bacterium]|nr:hypothetical protein [Neisseriaceae bacterium]